MTMPPHVAAIADFITDEIPEYRFGFVALSIALAERFPDADPSDVQTALQLATETILAEFQASLAHDRDLTGIVGVHQ